MRISRYLMVVWLAVFGLISTDAAAIQLPRITSSQLPIQLPRIIPSQVGVMAEKSTFKDKLVRSKLARNALGVFTAAFILCTGGVGLTGCEQIGASRGVAEILGAKGPYQVDIQVMVDGVLYEGYLSQDATGTYFAEIADDSGPIVFVEHTDGFVGAVVEGHVNVGRKVYLTDEVGGHYLVRYGMVERVFENSYHEIIIDREVYTNIDVAGEINVAALSPAGIAEDRMLAMPYPVLAYQKAPVGKGGFEFMEGETGDGYLGAVLLGHADLDRPVHVIVVRDGVQVDLYGEVERVFENGYYEITVTAEAVAGGDPVAVDYDIISHEDVPLAEGEGGFEFTD